MTGDGLTDLCGMKLKNAIAETKIRDRGLRIGTFTAATSKQVLCFQFSSPLIGRFMLNALNVTNQNLFSPLDVVFGHQVDVGVHKLLAHYHGIRFTGMIQMSSQCENTSNPRGYLFVDQPIHSSFQLELVVLAIAVVGGGVRRR